MKTLFAITLLGLLAAAFVWERSAMETLRAQNEPLRADKLETERLVDENRELPTLRAAAVPPAGQTDHTELLRLRNEVRQLRGQQQEAGKLRAANQRAAEELKAGKFTPRRLADMEGFIPREHWADAGFATPEAAVQSFFAAMISTDPEQVIRCAAPEVAEEMRKDVARDLENFWRNLQDELGKVSKVAGLRITGRSKTDENRIVISVQLSADGESHGFPVRRYGNEWKLDQ